jgi:hypothetical protein
MTVRLNRYALSALVVGATTLGLMGCSSDDTPSTATVDAGSTDAGGGDSASPTTGGGPGATLKCDSSGKNAWETYGVSAFVAVNEAIFANVIAEGSASGTTNLGDSFTKIGSGNPASTADDLPTFKGNLAAFLVFAYGGPSEITYTDNKKYTGPQDMVESHKGLGITGAQYDYFVSNIVVPALTKNGVKAGKGGAADPNDVSSCFAPILVDAAFKASIVGQ